MKRRLFNILAAVSLVLGVGFAVATVRSAFVYDAVCYAHLSEMDGRYTQLVLCCGGGSVGLEIVRVRLSSGELAMRRRMLGWSCVRFALQPAEWHAFSFHWQRGAGPGVTGWAWSAAIPAWLPAAVAILSTVWMLRHRRADIGRCRRGLGLCLACGYDLRASGERCPECGTPIPADLVRRPLT